MTRADALAVDGPSGSPAGATPQDPPGAAVPTGAPTGAPVLSAEGFAGPIDWLLEMARAQKIDLARLPIAALIQSFAAALEMALARPRTHAPPLARWGDWLVMAATLTQLRSRLLLPVDAPEAMAALDEAEAWRRRLLGRERMRAAADWLEGRPQLGREVFARGQPEGRTIIRGGDIADLLRACLTLLKVTDELAAPYRSRPPAFWQVSQAIVEIETMLRKQPRGAALSAFLPAVATERPDRKLRCRAAVASTLLAGLELARRGTVTLRQGEAWGKILITAASRDHVVSNTGATT